MCYKKPLAPLYINLSWNSSDPKRKLTIKLYSNESVIYNLLYKPIRLSDNGFTINPVAMIKQFVIIDSLSILFQFILHLKAMTRMKKERSQL